jgi:hypothetical protein
VQQGKHQVAKQSSAPAPPTPNFCLMLLRCIQSGRPGMKNVRAQHMIMQEELHQLKFESSGLCGKCVRWWSVLPNMHGPHQITAQHVPASSQEQMLCFQEVVGVSVVMLTVMVLYDIRLGID